jgi:hypothetical protein
MHACEYSNALCCADATLPTLLSNYMYVQAAAAMNKQMEKSKVMEHLKEFEKANMQMDMKSEMMDELLDGVFDDEGADAEVSVCSWWLVLCGGGSVWVCVVCVCVCVRGVGGWVGDSSSCF